MNFWKKIDVLCSFIQMYQSHIWSWKDLLIFKLFCKPSDSFLFYFNDILYDILG
jgi:hypothetical protein